MYRIGILSILLAALSFPVACSNPSRALMDACEAGNLAAAARLIVDDGVRPYGFADQLDDVSLLHIAVRRKDAALLSLLLGGTGVVSEGVRTQLAAYMTGS